MKNTSKLLLLFVIGVFSANVYGMQAMRGLFQKVNTARTQMVQRVKNAGIDNSLVRTKDIKHHKIVMLASIMTLAVMSHRSGAEIAQLRFKVHFLREDLRSLHYQVHSLKEDVANIPKINK